MSTEVRVTAIKVAEIRVKEVRVTDSDNSSKKQIL